MNNKATSVLLFLLISVFVTACARSPVTKFYRLNALPNSEITEPLLIDGQKVTIKVGPVSIPDSLDKKQIVTLAGVNSLILDEFNRWGGDLQSDIQRVLGENLSLLVPTDQVILSDEISMIPVDFQVLVNVREFSGTLGGIVTLNADWTIAELLGKKSVISKKSVLTEQTQDEAYSSYVSAQSRLLTRLSQQIAREISRQINAKQTIN